MITLAYCHLVHTSQFDTSTCQVPFAIHGSTHRNDDLWVTIAEDVAFFSIMFTRTCILFVSIIGAFCREFPRRPKEEAWLGKQDKAMLMELTWWLGKMSVSATTTFSRRVALKTMTSAMSSGVRGSTPLEV